MLLIRHFEERCVALSLEGEFPGTTPVCVGQEVAAVALGVVLESSDLLFTTHRNHGHLLGRGADPRRLMAELYGKATGYCGGKGGSFHVSSVEVGIPSASAILAAGMSTATGAAQAFRLTGQRHVAISCLGDRSLTEGAAWEALNLAALWQAPVVFLCENNDAHPYDPGRSFLATDRIAGLARPLRLDVTEVDGSDMDAMVATLGAAVDRARNGGGPAFLEVLTTRWIGALGGGRYSLEQGLTRAAEMVRTSTASRGNEWWTEHDPLLRFARALLASGTIEWTDLAQMEDACLAEVEDAVEFARGSPFPQTASAFEGVYA